MVGYKDFWPSRIGRNSTLQPTVSGGGSADFENMHIGMRK